MDEHDEQQRDAREKDVHDVQRQVTSLLEALEFQDRYAVFRFIEAYWGYNESSNG